MAQALAHGLGFEEPEDWAEKLADAGKAPNSAEIGLQSGVPESV